SYISNVKDIKILSIQNKPQNVIFKYVIFRFISVIIYFFEYLRAKVDISANKVHMYIHKENVDKYIIIEDTHNKIVFSTLHNNIIHIRIISAGKIKTLKLSFNEVKYKHINYII